MTNRVLLVAFFRGPAVFYGMSAHSVSPTVVGYITVAPNTSATLPISSVLRTVSSSTAISSLSAVVFTASLATDVSEVRLLKEGVLVIDRACHGGWWR